MKTKSFTSSPHSSAYLESFWLYSIIFAVSLLTPLTVSAATPWQSQGETHVVTLTENGKVLAMGGNEFGQLGNGSFDEEFHEQAIIKGLDDITAVSTGGNHSVALKKDGTVWTWGLNRTGQLGNGTTKNSSIPVKVAGLTQVTAIATGGSHVVVLRKDGTVWAWGGNQSGQLGNGQNQDCLSPIQVPGLHNVTAITAGAYNTSVLKNDGTVWSWGFNGSGQLGNGSSKRSNTPVRVSGLRNIRAISAGEWHVTAVRRDGTVWAWGNNDKQQLGHIKVTYSSFPVQVQGVAGVIDVVASQWHTIAITRDNNVLAWGEAGGSQLEHSDIAQLSGSPVPETGMTVASVVNPATVNSQNSETDSLSLMADAGNLDDSFYQIEQNADSQLHHSF
ncbi:MAG: hypothetical protein PHI31_13975 [Desulfuromonadaceae bacterium]|nr:hypothetical protein [Desulfuromonadaceae bacterium]